MSVTPSPVRHKRGLWIIIILSVIFFTLMGLLLLTTGRRRPEAEARSETLTVLPPKVRIRTEPNGRAPVVSSAAAGDQLSLIEEHGDWVRVQTSDGLSGWTERSALERTAERERRLSRYTAIRKMPPLSGVSMNRAPLYAGPGIFYPVIGELTARTPVRIFTRDHDFYAIESGSQIAYADVDAIDVSAAGMPRLEVSPSTMPSVVSDTAATSTTAAASTTTATASAPAPPIVAPETREPAAPPPVAEVVRTDRSGVYSVVPPGGTQPEEIDRVVPRYPPLARRSGVGGAVVIRGIVRRDGTIDDVQVLKDLPYGLGDSAREAVERWRFRPATYRGEPIDVYYTVTVNFRLQ